MIRVTGGKRWNRLDWTLGHSGEGKKINPN